MATTQGYDISARSIAADQFNSKQSSYASFSGCNIVAHINHVAISSMMGVSYAIHTETAANYVMGKQNPVSFVTGKRGTAGTLVFAQFDKDPLLSVFTGTNGSGQPLLKYSGDAVKGTAFGAYNSTVGTSSANGFPTGLAIGQNVDTANGNYLNALSNDIGDAFDAQFKVPLEYADQLPPFDVTLGMTNAQGQGAYMVIFGIKVINQGGGFTIDDSRNETAYTYVCEGIRPLQPVFPNGQLFDSNVLLSSATSNTL